MFGRRSRRYRKTLPKGVSGGVKETPALTQPFYNDSLGFGYDDVLTASYVFNDAAGFGIDESLAGGETGNDASGFWVDL